MPANLTVLDGWVNIMRRKNRLVYEHRQERFINVGAPGPWGVSKDGYCVAMAVDWCRRRLSNEDFDYDTTSQKLQHPPIDILRLHHKIVSSDMAQVLTELGIAQGTSKWCALTPTWVRLKQRLGTEGLFIVTFSKAPNTTGHVVAFQFSKVGSVETYRFFDPNFGHFAFSQQTEFDNAMKLFLDKGYSASGEYTEAYILPVSASGSTAGRVAALKKMFGG